MCAADVVLCALFCESVLCFGLISHSLPRISDIWQIYHGLLKDGPPHADGSLLFASRLVLMCSTCARLQVE